MGKSGLKQPAADFSFEEHSLFRAGDWDKWSAFAVVVCYDRARDIVYVKIYGHCSCFGSETAVLDGDYKSRPESKAFSDVNWTWWGSSSELANIATKRLDIKFPERKALPEDYDSGIMSALYTHYLDWIKKNKPAWRDKRFKFRVKFRAQKSKQ